MFCRAVAVLTFASLVSSSPSFAGEVSSAQQKEIIAKIRRLAAQSLDPAQPPIPLEEWLHQTIPSHGKQKWEMGSCDLKPNFGESRDLWPMCVVARVPGDPGGFGIRLHILVGSWGQGAVGKPAVHSQSFLWRHCDEPIESPISWMRSVRSLSSIPREMKELASNTNCKVRDDAVVQSYALHLGAIRAGTPDPPGISFERLLEEVRLMKRLLLETVGDSTAMEAMSDATFARVQNLAEGVIVNREEVLIVEPDPRFFLSLVRRYGRAADVVFFKTLDQTYRGTVWPSYVQQVTDIQGCTDFGSGELVARYRAWSSFRSRFPEEYVDEAEQQLREIERHVAEGTCACGDRASVVDELKKFAAAFPGSPVHDAVKLRIEAISQKKSDLRFNCNP